MTEAPTETVTPPEKPEDPTLKELTGNIEKCETTEEKVRLVLDFMKETVSEEGAPRFKHFWEARKICIPLFKEGVHPAIRSQLWEEFSDLSKEARALKEHLDKAAAFAAEQIALAVESMEKELGEVQDKIREVKPITLPMPSKVMQGRLGSYQGTQQELTLLNQWAQRINALRKELIDTPMRLRDKNQLFRRLSAAGEQVFPRRKELIKEVSDHFLSDIESFVKRHFGAEGPKGPLYELRSEIKALQAFAKVITLNTQTFTKVRSKLSECWDQVKSSDRDRKKEVAEKRAAFREMFDPWAGKVDEAVSKLQEGEATTDETDKAVEELHAEAKKWEINPKDRQHVKEKLSGARKVIFQKQKEAQEKREQESQERFEALKAKADALVEKGVKAGAQTLKEGRSSLKEEIAATSLLAKHRQQLQGMLEPLAEMIVEAQEHDALAASDGDERTLKLREVLQSRRQRRAQVKAKVEELRREKGGSGSDFQKALEIDAQLKEEKEKLEALDAGIAEIEGQLS